MLKSISQVLVIVSLIVTLFSCKTQIHPGKPDAEYVTSKFQKQLSNINIPITIALSTLAKDVNANLQGLLYEDDTYTDESAEEKYRIKIFKAGEIKIQGAGKKLYYTVPLNAKIDFQKNILGFNLEKSLDLDIDLDFASEIIINEDWTYSTKTESRGFDLKSDPSIEVGFISIPVSSVIDLILGYSMKDITSAMDDGFSEAFELQTIMEKLWVEMQEPFLMDEEYNAWMMITPEAVHMDRIRSDRKQMKMIFGIDAYFEMKIGEKPVREIQYEHPKLTKQVGLSPNYYFTFPIQFSYEQLSGILQENLIGYKYQHGKKTIEVVDVDAFGNGNKVVIQVGFQGDAEGELFLTGVPKFDNATKTIFIEDFDYDVKSKKAVLKLASWILKGPFKKNIEKELSYPFDENLETFSKQLSDGFEEQSLGELFDFQVQIDSINIEHITVEEFGLKMKSEVFGKSQLHYGQ